MLILVVYKVTKESRQETYIILGKSYTFTSVLQCQEKKYGIEGV
jgi:hypothetical protein